MRIAVQQTVHWLVMQTIVPMSHEEGYALIPIVGDYRVTPDRHRAAPRRPAA